MFPRQNTRRRTTLKKQPGSLSRHSHNKGSGKPGGIQYRLDLVTRLGQKYGTSFFSDWTFFRVEDSEFMRFLSSESYKISESQKLVEYVFITPNNVFEVVATYDPEVTRKLTSLRDSPQN